MSTTTYRQLANAGNKHARHILDAGVIPDAEMDEGETSESEELEDLVELAAQVEALVAKAAAHVQSRDNMRAADAHMERGRLHENAGQHEQAMGAYKDAALSLWTHAKDCGYAQGYDLPQIQAIHARMTAEKGG